MLECLPACWSYWYWSVARPEGPADTQVDRPWQPSEARYYRQGQSGWLASCWQDTPSAAPCFPSWQRRAEDWRSWSWRQSPVSYLAPDPLYPWPWRTWSMSDEFSDTVHGTLPSTNQRQMRSLAHRRGHLLRNRWSISRFCSFNYCWHQYTYSWFLWYKLSTWTWLNGDLIFFLGRVVVDSSHNLESNVTLPCIVNSH